MDSGCCKYGAGEYREFFEELSNLFLLYSRTLAWYGSTPDKSKSSRFEIAQGNTLGQRDDDGELIRGPAGVQLPEIPGPWTYLLGFFNLSGQCTQSGMGLAPLSWQELKAFREENELDITLWERELLKKMSEAYCAEYSRASDPHRPSPYTPDVVDEEIDHIGNALRMMEQLHMRGSKTNEFTTQTKR